MLIDTNVFAYVLGRDHAFQGPSERLIAAVAEGRIMACTDAEVLQEILHRYHGEERRQAREAAFDLVVTTVPRIHPLDVAVAEAARDLMRRFPALSGRDAAHLGVCVVHHVDAICSYDTDFDVAREVIPRVEPGRVFA